MCFLPLPCVCSPYYTDPAPQGQAGCFLGYPKFCVGFLFSSPISTGPVKIYAQNCLQAPADLKSAGNRGIVHGRLQMLHVHVFLAAPLGARHMAEPGADQHQGGVAVRECPHHAGPVADLAVQPLDHVVGADARPVLAGEIAVGQRLLDAVLDLLGGLLQLHGAQLGNDGLRLLAGRLFALLGVDRLEHFCHNFDLGFGHNGENIAVEKHRAALVSIMR